MNRKACSPSWVLEDNGLLEALKEEPRADFKLALGLEGSVLPSLAEDLLSFASDVRVSQWGQVPEALHSACTKIASNSALRSLTVAHGVDDGLGGDLSELGEVLSSAIKESKGLCRFELDLCMVNGDTDISGPVAEMFAALASIPCLRQVSLTVRRVNPALAQRLLDLVSKCRRSLVELHVKSLDALTTASIVLLQEMLSGNPFLCRVTFSSYQENVSLTDATLDEAIEQNWGLLNRASRFVRCVVSEAEARTIDRRWVSAFDEVHDTASLADHLANLTKKTPREVLADIKKARRCVAENFLVFAGVVQFSLTCTAGGGRFQIGDLNVDCLRAIFGYLKLTDVVKV